MYYTKLTGSLEPQPTPKKVRLTIDSRKGSPDISRPIYVASNETINDTRNYIDRTPSRRTIRTEDMDMRPRILDEDTQGRLLTDEQDLNFEEINADAEKYSRIGEKVLTRLFKVQVPDDADTEYINKRSEVMAQMGMTKEQADVYLAENFRKQYTKTEDINIARMNKPFTEMMNIFNELQKTLMKSPQNTGMMKNMLNNMLIKEGDRTFEDIMKVIAILVNNPQYRINYKPDSIYRTLGVLSNIVVGNNGDLQDGNVESKDANPDVFRIIHQSQEIKNELVDAINNMKNGLYDIREEEEEKDDTLVDIDSVLAGDMGTIPIPVLSDDADILSVDEDDIDIGTADIVPMADDEALLLSVVKEQMEREKRLVNKGEMTAEEYNKNLRELLAQIAPDEAVKKIFRMLSISEEEVEEVKEDIFASVSSLEKALEGKKLRAIKKSARDFNRMVGTDSPYHIKNIDGYKKADKEKLKNILIENLKRSKGMSVEVVKKQDIFAKLPNKIRTCFIDNLTKKKTMNTQIVNKYNMDDINKNNFMDKITDLRKETRISNSTYQKVLNCVNRSVIKTMLQAGQLDKKEGDELRKDIAGISGNVTDRVDTLEQMLTSLVSQTSGSGLMSKEEKEFRKKSKKLSKKYAKKAEEIASKEIQDRITGKKKKKKKDEEYDIISQVDEILGMGEAIIGTGKKKASITCPKGHSVCTCKRKSTSWMEHVKKVRQEKGLSYKEALIEAKKTYKK